MRILILGRNEVLYFAAEQLSKSHDIVAVVTAKASPIFLKKENDFQDLASRLNVPFILTAKVDAAVKKLIQNTRPDVIVSSHWVSTIGPEVFQMVQHGILNAHHGRLPAYRGNAATNWMLLKFEKYLYLNIHFMQPGELDSGKIALQKRVALRPDITIRQMNELIDKHVPAMFCSVVSRLEAGTLKSKKQRQFGGFRCYPRIPEHSKIQWSASAREIDALVRASTRPYGGAYSYMKTQDGIRRVTIWSSRIVAAATKDLGMPGHIIRNDVETGESWVFTGRGILGLLMVQYDDGPEFQPGKIWKSIRIGFGVDVEHELMALTRKLESADV